MKKKKQSLRCSPFASLNNLLNWVGDVHALNNWNVIRPLNPTLNHLLNRVGDTGHGETVSECRQQTKRHKSQNQKTACKSTATQNTLRFPKVTCICKNGRSDPRGFGKTCIIQCAGPPFSIGSKQVTRCRRRQNFFTVFWVNFHSLDGGLMLMQKVTN